MTWRGILTLALALTQPLHASVAGELQPYKGTATTPPLELADLSGREHRLSDYRGQVVLVNFWASWCPPCLAEMPSMQRLATLLKEKPFRILAVNVEQSKSTVWRFTKLLEIEFTTLLDSAGETAKAWAIETYPTSYLIDSEGRIRYMIRGALEWDSLETQEVIKSLLPETSVDEHPPAQQIVGAGPAVNSNRNVSAYGTLSAH